MKKKIFLMLAVMAMLVCVFAISVSAATLYKTADGTTLFTGVDENADRIFDSYDGSFPNTDESDNALTWYIVSTETTETDTVHTVASFLTLDTTGEHASLSDAGVYKYVNTEKELSLVSVYFPNNSGILTLNLSGDGYGNTYDFATDKSNLLYLTLPNTLTELPSRVCQSTPVIDCTIPDEAPFESISAVAFYKAKNLYSVDIPANVTIIYSNGHSNDGYPFFECVSLVDVDFAENSKLETIQQNAFNRCTALKEITIPNSVVNLANNVFMYCSGLETVRLGANAGKGLTVYNVQSMLYGCNALKYVYMSDTMVPTTGSHLFASGATGMVIFYTGDQEQYEALKTVLTTLTNNGKFINATAVEWDSTKDDQYYKDLAANEKKNYVVYGYNTCQAFYDNNHAEQAPTYGFSGEKYISDFCSFAKCERCPSTVEAKVIGSLFTSKGYSKSDDAFMYDIKVNFDAIDAYKEFYKEKFGKDVEINYGLVISGNTSLTELLDSDGKENDNVIKMTFDGTVYSNIQIKFMGIVDPEKEINNSNTYIHACAYVIEDENIFYIGDGATDTVSKTICYNDIKNEE